MDTALKQILEDHKTFLITGGTEGKQADLSEANLHGINLYEADLQFANLTKTNLANAILIRANLRGAILEGADLTGTRLANAYMGYSTLTNAILYTADLSGANLFGADLSGADIRRTLLHGVRLAGAILPHPVYQFFVGNHEAIATPTELSIGCECHPWEYWLKEYKNVGKAFKYSPADIKKHSIMIKAMYKAMMLATK